MTERHTTRLKRLVRAPEILVAPGVVDGIGARLVAGIGFDAIYMTGAGTTASRLGMPDVGLLTMTEMADNAARIADASGLPLLADADTGYGGPVNVRRTVQAYERAGVAGLHIEDQSWPKRCGHLAGKTVIPKEEMAAKIRAACDARVDADLQIVARCDAIAVEGWEAAMDRAAAYEEAGADILFIEAMTTMEQLAHASEDLFGALPLQHGVERKDPGPLRGRDGGSGVRDRDLPRRCGVGRDSGDGACPAHAEGHGRHTAAAQRAHAVPRIFRPHGNGGGAGARGPVRRR